MVAESNSRPDKICLTLSGFGTANVVERTLYYCAINVFHVARSWGNSKYPIHSKEEPIKFTVNKFIKT